MLKPITNYVHHICEPRDSKSTPDPCIKQYIWNRNITNTYILLVINIIFIITLPFSSNSLTMDLMNVIGNLVVFAAFLLTCRSYLWLFSLLHTLLISFAAFPAFEVIPEFVYFYIGYAFSLPIFILVFSGDSRLAFFSGGMQVLISHTRFKYHLKETLLFEDPHVFTEKFVGATSFLFVLMLISNLVLLRTLDKRSVELLKAKKTIEDTLDQQKTFLLSFSHELRNPINSLLGNLQLVLQGESLSPKAREMIQIAKTCGDILLHGINNVLDTGKCEIEKLEVNPVPTQLHELFQRTWGIYSEILRQKKLHSQLKIEKTIPPVVKIDKHKVSQILLNLIGNSIKFTEQGSISVTIKWLKYEQVHDKCFEPIPYDDTNEGIFEKDENLSTINTSKFSQSQSSFLVLSTDRKHFSYDEVVYPQNEVNGVVKIIVKDTGSGIRKEALSKLFQKFSQVSESVAQRQIGTGLGLFITKAICQAMNGDIRAYSKIGKGTTFVVCLPATALTIRKLNNTDSQSMLDKLAEKRIKALIADDSPFNPLQSENLKESEPHPSQFLFGAQGVNVNLTCNYFEKLGASIASLAYNGYDAYTKYIECIKNRIEVNVVTLDIDMPIMDGRVVCEKIRQYEKENRLRPVKIILISGNYDKEQINDYVDQRRGHRADCFLKKPVSFEDFNLAIYNLFFNQQEKNLQQF